MEVLVLLALIGVVAKLWSDVGSLRRRLLAVEVAHRVNEWAASPEQRESAPAPVAATVATAARVVHGRTVALAPSVQTPLAEQPHAAPEPVEVSRPASDADESDAPEPDQPSPAPAGTRSGADAWTPASAGEDHAPPAVEVAGSTQPAPIRNARPTLSFEDLFGRKLPIWAGGITLAVCGFLIVKYSIDAGLLSPWVRVVGGLLFGFGLIAGAEAASQNEARVRDPRVRQALAGAGVATLYASILMAANVYALVPPLAAFAGLALTTLLAGFLSIRFGAASAVLGLVGGLAAPALVGAGSPNVPLLAAYLALAVAGLATLGRTQRWWWLGAAALVGGFGWGLVLIVAGTLSSGDALAVGALLLLLGVGLPVLLFEGRIGTVMRLAGTLAAAAQLALLVASGGFALLHWGLFGLLALVAVWLSRREAPLADLPAPALATALFLLAAWPDPTVKQFALILGTAAAIFGLPAAWRVWRADGRLSDAAAVAALAAAPLLLDIWHFNPSEAAATQLALLGTAAAGAVAALGWRSERRRGDIRFALLVATAALLAGTAAAIALPTWLIAPAWAIIAAALILLAGPAADRRVEAVAWAAGALTMALLLLDPTGTGALPWAAGLPGTQPGWHEAISWGVPAALALVFARFGRGVAAEPVASAAAVLLGYVAVAQLLPWAVMPLVPAAAVAALGWFRRSDAATVTAGALAVAWAAWPAAEWLSTNGAALVGLPSYVDALPTVAQAATRLLAPGIAAAVVLWRRPPAQARVRQGWIAGVALLGGIAVHIGWKQLFAIQGARDFVHLGLAERTAWEALLTVAAVALHRRLPRVAHALGLAALAHLAWFTLVLHNPLWAPQAVGALPLLNLLLPAYALGFALLWAAGRFDLPPLAERARGWGQMLLIGLFAASELRQLAHGSLISRGGVAEAEDIARSILAIAIAIGFLQWGIRRRNRDWRIASLVMMLGAVLKVFLLDAAGLHGLLQIASFGALGFSLIGLGWLYSRYLPDEGAASAAPPSHSLPTVRPE